MKKSYIIIATIIIILIFLVIIIWDYKLQIKKENEFNNLVESIKKLDDNIKNEINKIDSNIDNVDSEKIEEKIDKISELAFKAKKENEDILSSDVLKSGTSTGIKYSGEACKDACW